MDTIGDDAGGRLAFVESHMPLVGSIARRFDVERPFDGLDLAVRIHVEAKTAVLIQALRKGGASVVAMGNQGTTDDAIASLLRADGVDVIGGRSDSKKDIAAGLEALIESSPDLVLDNGAEVIEGLVQAGAAPIGATEETTSGAMRLRDRLAGKVSFPVIVINDSPLKAIVENKHGVGQSVVQVILQTSNVLISGKAFIVFGYGWCGRGIAHYARGYGARVSVVEPDEIKALEAVVDGFTVLETEDALAQGEIFVTATGAESVLGLAQLRGMRDGSIVANAGHFDTEIDMVALRRETTAEERGQSVTRHRFADNHAIDVLAEGQMVNLAAGGSRGNAIEIMDLGFALQALALERLVHPPGSLTAGDQPVPDDINRHVAAAMVRRMMGES